MKRLVQRGLDTVRRACNIGAIRDLFRSESYKEIYFPDPKKEREFREREDALCRRVDAAHIALSEGREVEPPWIVFPGCYRWNQGINEAYFRYAWTPFWKGLTVEERLTFLDKWNPPTDWREDLMSPGWNTVESDSTL